MKCKNKKCEYYHKGKECIQDIQHYSCRFNIKHDLIAWDRKCKIEAMREYRERIKYQER